MYFAFLISIITYFFRMKIENSMFGVLLLVAVFASASADETISKLSIVS